MYNILYSFVEAISYGIDAFIQKIPIITIAFVVFFIGYFVINKVLYIIRYALSKKTDDSIVVGIIISIVRVLLFFVLILLLLHIFGLQEVANDIFTIMGASAIAIGFAFKDIGENFLAGIILAFTKPFGLNDFVETGGFFGKVTAIKSRYTKLRTFDGKYVYIPNSDIIKNPLTNHTENGWYRFRIDVGIDYENDTEAAIELIYTTLKTVPGVATDNQHKHVIALDEFSSSSVNIKIQFWVKDYTKTPESSRARGAAMLAIKSALEKNGFSIPCNVQELKLHDTQKHIPINILQEKSK